MPTRAKAVQFKDLRQGRAFWYVEAGFGVEDNGMTLINRAADPVQAFITSAPRLRKRKTFSMDAQVLGQHHLPMMRLKLAFHEVETSPEILGVASPWTKDREELAWNHARLFTSLNAARRYADWFLYHYVPGDEESETVLQQLGGDSLGLWIHGQEIDLDDPNAALPENHEDIDENLFVPDYRQRDDYYKAMTVVSGLAHKVARGDRDDDGAGDTRFALAP